MGRTLQTLTKAEVVEINRQMVETFGGVFFSKTSNLIHPGSLDFLMELISGALFQIDEDPYPTVQEKAAILAYRIIGGHVFFDGNKRTGMEACRLFLELNHYNLVIDQRAVSIALGIAKRELSIDQVVQWVKDNSTYLD